MPEKLKEKIIQTARLFVKFCGVGAINTILALALILFLSEILHMHYALANALGYLFGLGISFILHRVFTFQKTGDNHTWQTQITPFVIIFCIAYACQFALLYAMINTLHWPQALAQTLAIGAYTIINFAGNKWKTFK